MTKEQYQEAVQMCALAGGALTAHDLPGLLEAIDHAEVAGPLLDPTLYREKGAEMNHDKKLLEAALPLWRFVKAMKEKAGRESTER